MDETPDDYLKNLLCRDHLMARKYRLEIKDIKIRISSLSLKMILTILLLIFIEDSHIDSKKIENQY